MQFDVKLDNQTRAIAMATGGAVLAAVAAMFIPTAIWETLTGSTGVSEMIPATAAPLGDTARALISFGFGALTFAILSVLLLRKGAKPRRPVLAQTEPEAVWAEPEPVEAIDELESEEAESSSVLSRLRGRISAFAEARRSGTDIIDLEDLPKLRAGDAHPDAPPRRPLSANRDLADPVAEVAAAAAAAGSAMVDAEYVAPVIAKPVQVEPVAEIEVQPVAEAPSQPDTVPVASGNPAGASLEEMVSRFESALAERDAQLARIDALSNELQASNVQPIRSVIEEPKAAEPTAPDPAPLRAVETPEIASEVPERPESEELDAALRSALETLHRMNARTR